MPALAPLAVLAETPPAEEEISVLNLARAIGPTTEQQLFARQVAQRITSALTRLRLRQCAAFTLRHYEDRSLADIAEILKLDVGTVKAHLFRATAKLREELHDLYFQDVNQNAGEEK